MHALDKSAELVLNNLSKSINHLAQAINACNNETVSEESVKALEDSVARLKKVSQQQ